MQVFKSHWIWKFKSLKVLVFIKSAWRFLNSSCFKSCLHWCVFKCPWEYRSFNAIDVIIFKTLRIMRMISIYVFIWLRFQQRFQIDAIHANTLSILEHMLVHQFMWAESKKSCVFKRKRICGAFIVSRYFWQWKDIMLLYWCGSNLFLIVIQRLLTTPAFYSLNILIYDLECLVDRQVT